MWASDWVSTNSPLDWCEDRTFCSGSRFFRMELSKKVKVGLDESRMLVLGSQVFIGFQFRSVFQNAFEALPPWSRHLDGVALLLMVSALGMLIFPGPFHRIVEEGRNSGRLHALICNVTFGRLLYLQLALGVFRRAILTPEVWPVALLALLRSERWGEC
jgi:uncharacterized protein DUF6328